MTKKNGRLANVPFSDNSYKWAGGGFVSTVGDLLKFGNSMLYSYQWKPDMTLVDGKLVKQIENKESTQTAPDLPPGYLKPETVSAMWKVVPQTKSILGSSRSVFKLIVMELKKVSHHYNTFVGTEKMAMDWGGRWCLT